CHTPYDTGAALLYHLSLHDALPISLGRLAAGVAQTAPSRHSALSVRRAWPSSSRYSWHSSLSASCAPVFTSAPNSASRVALRARRVSAVRGRSGRAQASKALTGQPSVAVDVDPHLAQGRCRGQRLEQVVDHQGLQ